MTIGERLKAIRKSRGLRLIDVERRTGILNSYISQLENNHINIPNIGKLKKLVDFYQVDLDDVLYDEKTKKRANPLAHLSDEKKEAIIQAFKKSMF